MRAFTLSKARTNLVSASDADVRKQFISMYVPYQLREYTLGHERHPVDCIVPGSYVWFRCLQIRQQLGSWISQSVECILVHVIYRCNSDSYCASFTNMYRDCSLNNQVIGPD